MEQREDLSADKLRGGYYTPIEIADFLVTWGMEISPSHILEPSCGDGIFIKALQKFGLTDDSKLDGCNIQAIELVDEEAKKSKKVFHDLVKSTKATGKCTHSEFFEFTQKNYHSSKPSLRPNLILGNPPYIRYQSFINGRDLAEKRLLQIGIKTTKHANSWLHFLAESVSLLDTTKKSRIGFVIPTELLHITYASHLRRWLETHLTDIRIITFKNLVFEGIQQEVILFLGERDPSIIDSKGFERGNLRLLEFEDVSSIPSNVWNHFNNKAPKAYQFQDKWTGYFLEKNELVTYHKLKKAYPSFTDHLSIDIGIVTGANKFFCIKKQELEKLGAVVGKEYPGISVKRMMGRSNEVTGVRFTKADFDKNFQLEKPCSFLYFDKNFEYKKLKSNWKKKIKMGEKLELHQRYKCRIRDPWYSVPSVHFSELSMFKRASAYTRIIVNECEAYTTDTVYRIHRLDESSNISPSQLAFSFFNSLTFLSCELEGRFYGGGVLELVPSEVEQTILPLSNRITDEDFERLDKMIRDNVDIDEILDFTDGKLLKKIPKRERFMIRTSWKKLRDRRSYRAKSKKKDVGP
jgi:adenine-specific DNA-methyltransferase